jgi:aminoglycoside phosphotransferase (APT) family kinase protein
MVPEVAPEVAAVRVGEEIDARALGEYLRGKLEGSGGEVVVEQFPGGHSNLTYLVRVGGKEYVLRRPPIGPVAPKAHDMAREFRVLEAVHPVFPPAPRVFLLCEDPAAIGAAFFLMERRYGVVLRRDAPVEFASDPEFPRNASEGFIDCLAQLHAIDIERHGLSGLGRTEGFLERQVRGWSERWERAKTEELAGLDRLLRWLLNRLPVSPQATLIHNDFKLDNIMLDARDAGRVEAVLDWEMATVGDPLMDLGCTLCYWTQAGDPAMRGGALSGITAAPGWLTRGELVRRYSEKGARDVSSLGYYEVFGLFKLGVILQQIYFRYHRGQTHDERFRDFYLRVRGLMQAAMELAERLG